MGPYLSPFAEPLGTASAVFPVLAATLLVPLALFHYRHHGRVHPWRALTAYSFLFYLLAAVFLVLLPLPDLPAPADAARWREAHSRVAAPEMNPLAFLDPIVAAGGTAPRTQALLQAVFNGLLLFPFGFYLVFLFGRRWPEAWLGGWALSLLLETAQFTGLFGFYPGPYRLFDTGDLLLNSTGSLAGGWAATAALRWRWIPRLELLAGPTTPWIGLFRRTVALGWDLAASGTTAVILLALAGPALPDVALPALAAAAFAWWLIILPSLDLGRGLGRRLTLCAIRKPGGGLAPGLRILGRQSTLWAVPLGLWAASGTRPGHWWATVAVLAGLLWAGAVTVHLFRAATGPQHAGWIDWRFGTRVRNTWRPRL